MLFSACYFQLQSHYDSCSNNSALTTSVVGTLKSVAQTTMGMFTFGGVTINAPMLSGVTMNLSGGIVYTYAKYLEGEKVSQV